MSNATSEAGAVASLAEEKKCMKYSQLDSSHQFEPVAIETTGVIGERSRKFLVEEVNSTAFLLYTTAIHCSAEGECSFSAGDYRQH